MAIGDESHETLSLLIYDRTESTPRGGMNRFKANLMTNNAELKTNSNTLSVTKECSRILGERALDYLL